MKSAREIQEDLLALGHIDRQNRPINPPGMYVYAYANGVADVEMDAALGYRMGTTLEYTISQRLARLTGDTGVDAPAPALPPGNVYGSGIVGTQGPAAGDPGLHVPGEDEARAPTDEERKAAWLAHWEPMGFQYPLVLGDVVALRTEIGNVTHAKGIFPGLDEATVERWMGFEPGQIGRDYKAARGLS